MTWSKSLRLAVAAVALTAYANESYAQTSEALTNVRQEVASLDAWLGQGDNGQGWRAYLRLEELRHLLEQGDLADETAVSGILDKFTGDSVNRPQFQTVAQALKVWLAELQLPNRQELPSFVRAAIGSFQPAGEEQLKKAEADLRFALDRLERYLGHSSSGESWREYLNLTAIQPPLSSGAPPEVPLLDTMALRLGSGYPGLNLPAFEEARVALQAYLPLRRTADSADAAVEFDARLEALAAALEAYPAGFDPGQANVIGENLGWLADRSQAAVIVAEVRRLYSQPNLHVALSERLVAAGIERAVDEPTTVEDVILGTNIRGSGQTVGQLRVDLVPNDDYGVFDVLLSGHTYTQTIGRNGPATIHSSGDTRFSTRKRVFVSAAGVQTAPATARADTNSRTLGVNAGGGLATSIARGRVADSKAQGERISAEHAEVRLKRQVDEQAGAEFGEANRKFLEKLRRPLQARGAFPAEMRFSTTANHLRLTQLQATHDQLAAPTSAPQLADGYDLSVRVHQSMIENLARSVLAGQTLKQEELDRELNELFPGLIERIEASRAENAASAAEAADGEETDAADEDEEEEDDVPDAAPWEISFAEAEPVSVRFGGDQMTITLRCTRFKTTRVRRVPMNITAIYRLERGDAGLRLVRVEDLTILPPDFVPEAGARLSPEQTVVRRQLQRRFGEIFPAEIVPDGFTLPDDWARAGELTLAEAAAQDGWLTAGWRLPAAGAP